MCFPLSALPKQCLAIFNVLSYMGSGRTALDNGAIEDKDHSMEIFGSIIVAVLGVILLVVLIAFLVLFNTLTGLIFLIVFIFHSWFLLTVNTFYLQLSEEIQQSEPLQKSDVEKEMVP
uniref:CSON000524 protein n=1 Tax=Culicoides sonorensis TaxID=179676 RepID=A0A336MKD8_CULSO